MLLVTAKLALLSPGRYVHTMISGTIGAVCGGHLTMLAAGTASHMLLSLQQLATSVCSMFYHLAYDIDAACMNGNLQHFEVGGTGGSDNVAVTADAATAVVAAVAQAMVQHPAAEDLQVSTHILCGCYAVVHALYSF
jgi:hypothetical protein